jgi:uncharacterized protein
MTLLSILNCTNDALLAAHVRVAETLADRMKGLLGTSWLPGGHGLLLVPCNSIHTFGMQYNIDVIFLDADYVVKKIVGDLPPMLTARCPGGEMVLELPAGTVEATCTRVGQQLMAYAGDRA